MSDSMTSGLIGVDGGGTSCRIAMLHAGRRAEVAVGSANATTDFEASIATISEGLRMASAKLGLELDDVRDWPAYLGLAGVLGAALAGRIVSLLALRNAVVEDDRKTALAGALGDRTGSIAGIGTGSFLARQSDGGIRMIGGKGLHLGDEASGAWLGRELLRRVLHVVDGLEAPSALAQSVLDEFGADPGAIIAFARLAAPKDFGGFAPRVVTAAKSGDAIGLALMQAGAQYIERGLRALDYQPGEALCLLGGVAAQYRAYLPPAIASAVADPKGNALDGALALAARIAPRSQ